MNNLLNALLRNFPAVEQRSEGQLGGTNRTGTPTLGGRAQPNQPISAPSTPRDFSNWREILKNFLPKEGRIFSPFGNPRDFGRAFRQDTPDWIKPRGMGAYWS